MAKKKKMQAMSPEEAMEYINSIIDGETEMEEETTDNKKDDDLFGLKDMIFNNQPKEVAPKNNSANSNSFKKMATKQPKPKAVVKPSAPKKVEENSDKTSVNLRCFNIVPVTSLNRVVINDGISAYPLSLDIAEDQDLEDYSRENASTIVEMLKRFIVSRSFPTAIYTEEEFKMKNFYKKKNFLFFKENGYVYSYIIKDNAWQEFDSVISTTFKERDEINNERFYLKCYLSLALFVNEEHISFFSNSDQYIAYYLSDKDVNRKDIFEEEYAKAIENTSERAKCEDDDIEEFNQIIVNLIAELLGEDDDDDDDEEETTLEELEEEEDEIKKVLDSSIEEVVKDISSSPSSVSIMTEEEIDSVLEEDDAEEEEDEDEFILSVIRKNK